MNKKMYSIGLMTFFLVITFSSCRMPYEPDIEADQEILVVDALLTNRTSASYVKLSMAMPYDVTGTSPSVENATVYLTDYKHNRIYFSETSSGYYEPVDTVFAGEINVSYLLTVIMSDGCIYVSQPQRIPESMEPDSVYGGFDEEEYLTEDDFGKTVRVTEGVIAIYLDYMGEIVTPRFRYTSSQLVEWRVNHSYYWRTYTDNSLRFTNEKYTSASKYIYKQEVSTSPAIRQTVTLTVDDNEVTSYESKRIVEVNQYRLNDDSYAYYKNVEAQSEAEGKLFDPVTSPTKGNISCVSVPTKTVLGFFEASNFMTMSYVISRSWFGYDVTILEIDNLPPHSPSGWEKTAPAFWVE
jgi:Domain of unknown function (DUF4249)